jgi:WD40 repeat protein
MVTFSPDSRFLATVGSQAGMQIWDVTDPRRPTAVNDLGEFAISIAFSPDGHTLVTATFGKAIQVWDLADPRHPRRIATVPTVPTNGFPNSFNAATLAFSPDGHSLAIAADDRTTQLWDLTDPSHPTEIAAIPSQTGVVHALAFSPDGNTLATATDNHTVQLWESSPERLAAHICEIAYPRLTSAQWSQYLPNLRYQPPCA